MQSELRIRTHNATVSPGVRSLIEKEVAHLEAHFQRVVECAVRVEGPSAHQRKGGKYSVHLTLGIPGPDVQVSKQQHETLEGAVRGAFHVARRQLDERHWRQRERATRRRPKVSEESVS
ncbi:MAG: HPF/RaiA family ribosome-associated protein [Acidobacteriota bacterium]